MSLPRIDPHRLLAYKSLCFFSSLKSAWALERSSKELEKVQGKWLVEVREPKRPVTPCYVSRNPNIFLAAVTGGMLMVGRGIGQGVTQGDGRALVTGVTRGLSSVGTGVGQGVGTAVTGAADGFLSVGVGLFSGVKTVGKGIGGAFTGKKDDNSKRRNSGMR